MDFGKACEAILMISGKCNQYMEESAPWTLLKSDSEDDKKKAELILVSILEALRIIALALSPITPTLSCKIYTQLGLSGFESVQWASCQWGLLEEGHIMPKPKPVFARLEKEKVDMK